MKSLYIKILIGVVVTISIIGIFLILRTSSTTPKPTIQPTGKPTIQPKCNNPLFDPKDNCNSCLNKSFNFTSECTKCNNPLFDPNDNCKSCSNTNLSFDSGCKDCKNSDYNPPYCTDCKNPLLDPKDCKSCLNQKLSFSSECKDCTKLGYIAPDCTDCKNPLYDPTQNCKACKNSDLFPNCNSCSNQLFDPNNQCQSCLNPNQDFTHDCTTCTNDKLQYPDCKDCKDQHYIAPDCTQCKPEFSCGADCCTDPNTSCWGNVCCPKDRQGFDSNGNQVCCKSELCGTSCCETSSGQVCDTSDPNPSNHTCKVGCPDISNPDLYKCNGNVPSFPPDQDQKICKSGQKCAHDCASDKYECVDDVCQWDDTPVYTPVFLLDNDNKEFIYNNKPVLQCIPTTGGTCVQNPDSPFFIQNHPPSGTELCANVKVRAGLHNAQCDIHKCIDKISSASVDTINFGFNTQNTSMSEDTGLCTGYIGCNQPNALLNDADTKAVCDQLGANRCCLDGSGIPTGQVCPPNSLCVNDGGQYKCVNGFYYDTSSRKCLPTPKDYSGPYYPSYELCLQGTEYCPQDTSLPCIKSQSCICCGNWAKNDGTCNQVYSMTNDTVWYYFYGTLLWNFIKGFPSNIGCATTYIFIPSDLIVSFDPTENVSLKGKYQAYKDYPNLEFNVYLYNPNCQSDVNKLSVSLKNNGETVTYQIVTDATIYIKINDASGVTYAEQHNDFPNYKNRLFNDSVNPKNVNATVLLGDNNNDIRASFVFLNLPLKSSETYAMTATKAPGKHGYRRYKSLLLFIVLILLLLLLFWILRNNKF